MKKRLSIIMLSLAVILTMVAVNIHHHHHGEQMYIVLQENCETGNENGQENHDEEDHTQHYMPAAVVQLGSLDMVDHDIHGFHLFFSFLPADILTAPLVTIKVGHSVPKHPSTLYISQGRLCRGLRAPPAC